MDANCDTAHLSTGTSEGPNFVGPNANGNTESFAQEVATSFEGFSKEYMEAQLPSFIDYLGALPTPHSSLIDTDALESSFGSLSKGAVENILRFSENPRTAGISPDLVFENAAIESSEERLAKASGLLNRELTDHEKEGILYVHEMFSDKGVFELSQAEGAQKLLKLMKGYGFSKQEALTLCDYGICGIGKGMGDIIIGLKNIVSPVFSTLFNKGGVTLVLLAYYAAGIYGNDFIDGLVDHNGLGKFAVYLGSYVAAIYIYSIVNARVLGGEGGLKSLNKAMQRNNLLLASQAFLTGSHVMARYSENFDLFTKRFGEMPLSISAIALLFTFFLVAGQDRQGAGGIAEKSNQT